MNTQYCLALVWIALLGCIKWHLQRKLNNYQLTQQYKTTLAPSGQARNSKLQPFSDILCTRIFEKGPKFWQQDPHGPCINKTNDKTKTINKQNKIDDNYLMLNWITSNLLLAKWNTHLFNTPNKHFQKAIKHVTILK